MMAPNLVQLVIFILNGVQKRFKRGFKGLFKKELKGLQKRFKKDLKRI